MTRQDGLGWNCRLRRRLRQLHCISLILRGMRDQWIALKNFPVSRYPSSTLPIFFSSLTLIREKGDLVIRDNERNTVPNHTTRMANFDAARYLCQWSRLAKVIGGSLGVPPPNRSKVAGRVRNFRQIPQEELTACSFTVTKTWVFSISFRSLGQADRNPVIALRSSLLRIFDWRSNKYLPRYASRTDLRGHRDHSLLLWEKLRNRHWS